MGDFFSNSAATFFVGLGFTSLLCAALLAWLYVRKERRQRTDWEKTEADKADIMLLFQTMRDVIGQQKNLARDFNQELERKMKLVKQILAQSMEKNERLYDKQQKLVQELEEARAELRSLQRQTGFLKDNPPTAAPQKQMIPTQPELPEVSEPFLSLPGEEESDDDVFREVDSIPTPKPVQPKSVQRTPVQPKADTWIAETAEKTPVVEPPAAPTTPPTARPGSSADGFREIIEGLSNGHAQHEVSDVYLEDEEGDLDVVLDSPQEVNEARSAFRSLLDMPTASTAPAAVNGHATRSPLQQRVIEYHDAGMPIGDIARELGIGKGEVRLMLSLAKQEKG